MADAPLPPADYSLEHALAWRRADPVRWQAAQAGLLRDHLMRAGRSPYYRNLFKQAGFDPLEVNSVADLDQLPPTRRQDLESDPAAFQGVPDGKIRDWALTSGTTGGSLAVPYSGPDLIRLAFNEAAAFHGAGFKPGRRYLVTVTLDRCFIAGLAYVDGITRLGAAAIRSGPGQPALQWDLITRLKPHGAVGVPGFLKQLALAGRQRGIDPAAAGVETIVCIGEPVRRPDLSPTPLGAELSELWGATIHSTYASTEIGTAFTECAAGLGGHVHPELAVVEILDDAGRSVPEGEPGEVTVTPLGVEGLPLVRFRTGDVARLQIDPCPCGWTTPRLGPIEGRLAQRLKVRGTTLYPEAVFLALQEMPEVETAYLEVRAAADLSDELTVVAGGENGLDAEMLARRLGERLRVRPKAVVRPAVEVTAQMTREGGRKPKKFFDLRP